MKKLLFLGCIFFTYKITTMEIENLNIPEFYLTQIHNGTSKNFVLTIDGKYITTINSSKTLVIDDKSVTKLKIEDYIEPSLSKNVAQLKFVKNADKIKFIDISNPQAHLEYFLNIYSQLFKRDNKFYSSVDTDISKDGKKIVKSHKEYESQSPNYKRYIIQVDLEGESLNRSIITISN
ncbi:hypothetical protein M1446_03625 [Candidatus Dependentiae bacterium]|nr:hypothetical protein [Candidatus Dependentiae bacterium]